MDFMTIKDAAGKWNISKRRIQILCADGRIPGAERLGYCWAIPKDAEKPADARVKSGKYIGISKKINMQISKPLLIWRKRYERSGKIIDALSENADKLVIPVYQRNYDWKEEQCQKLYSDLVKTIRENVGGISSAASFPSAILWGAARIILSLMANSALPLSLFSCWLWQI